MDFPKYKPTIKTVYVCIDSITKNTETKKFKSKKDVWFNSSLFILELKKHNTTESISIRNGNSYFKQPEGFKDASDQSFNQKHTLLYCLAEN